MTDLNNHMDKIFREKLGNFSKDPPGEIWDAIRSETDKRRTRKLIMVAWRVAAGIAIIITAGYSYYYFNRTNKQQLTENKIDQQETIIKPEAADKKTLTERPSVAKEKSDENILVKSKKEYVAKKTQSVSTEKFAGITEEEKHEGKNKVEREKLSKRGEFQGSSDRNIYFSDLPYVLIPFTYKPDIIPDRKRSSINLLKGLNTSSELAEDKKADKDIWSISAHVSPTYNYRTLSQGDPGSMASINKAESGKVSYAGGLQLGLKATERLSIFAGLMYSKMGFEIKNVQFYQAEIRQSKGYGDFDANDQAKNITNLYSLSNSTGYISSAGSQNNLFASNNTGNQYVGPASQTSMSNTPGVLSGSDKFDQYFQFIELPFMLRYKLLDRKLRMNLLGGLSTNVLVGNRVIQVTGKNKTTIGETQGIRTINYSGNLGFGFDYDLGKNFLFTLEPQFKYYLNNFNENISLSSHPYSIGMFTGLRYIF
jgi:hypothetical protein